MAFRGFRKSTVPSRDTGGHSAVKKIEVFTTKSADTFTVPVSTAACRSIMTRIVMMAQLEIPNIGSVGVRFFEEGPRGRYGQCGGVSLSASSQRPALEPFRQNR